MVKRHFSFLSSICFNAFLENKITVRQRKVYFLIIDIGKVCQNRLTFKIFKINCHLHIRLYINFLKLGITFIANFLKCLKINNKSISDHWFIHLYVY